jgi:hypothetical protein
MKYLFIILVCLVLQCIACSKTGEDPNKDCTAVTITNTAPACDQWGIVVNGTKYPSLNIPDQFKQDGLMVCAVYEFYFDARACACCGGQYADIKSMKVFVR